MSNIFRYPRAANFRFTIFSLIKFVLLYVLLSSHAITAPIDELSYPEVCDDKLDERAPTHLLSLSGGGYRAMLFHVGVLWRLNEAGALIDLKRISSVSGGSITAGVLAANWKYLGFRDRSAKCFREVVVDPIMDLADTTIDVGAILKGALPFAKSTTFLNSSYRQTLFGKVNLQELPDSPQFIFNATNLQTGGNWRFSKEYMGEGALGIVCRPELLLATAVAASSAYPPILSPVTLRLGDEDWGVKNTSCVTEFNMIGSTGDINRVTKITEKDELAKYRKKVILADGGILDNLGVESQLAYLELNVGKATTDLFVSDGGASILHDSELKTDLISQTIRVLDIIHDQPSKFRRAYISTYQPKKNRTKVGIHVIDIRPSAGQNPALHSLAGMETRLQKLDRCRQKMLINWGYIAAGSKIVKEKRQKSEGVLPFPKYPIDDEEKVLNCINNGL